MFLSWDMMAAAYIVYTSMKFHNNSFFFFFVIIQNILPILYDLLVVRSSNKVIFFSVRELLHKWVNPHPHRFNHQQTD